MPGFEKKIKHLELIQAVVGRLANNSFLIKGWCVTLVAAILALANKETNRGFIAVVFVPILLFWMLDAYFLYQEKLFRELYDKVRKLDEAEIDFSMKVNTQNHARKFFAAVFSTTMLPFYGFMALAVIIASAVLFDKIKLN